MNFFRKPKVATLPEWLEIATRKLAAPAKERIKVEIEAHYAESVQAHIGRGQSDSEAQTAALTELGDANSSARRFRRRHLTESEAAILKWSNKPGGTKFSLPIGYFAFVLFTFEQGPMPLSGLTPCPSPYLFMLAEFLVLVVLPTICFKLPGSAGSKAILRSKILMMPLGGFPQGLLVKVLFVPGLKNILFAIPLCLILLVQILKAIHLWWKLGAVGSIHDEIPPLDTTASD